MKNIKWNNIKAIDLKSFVISIVKKGHNIEITTNLTEVNFLDATFNLERNTYPPNKKTNDSLTYINSSSNHQPQIKLLKISLKPSVKGYPEILQVLKYLNSQDQITKKTLKKYCYKTKLQYTQPKLQYNNTRRRTQKIIWCNPSFSLNVKQSSKNVFAVNR